MTHSTPAASRRAVVDRYLAAYNAFDVAAMVALAHPAMHFENVSGDQVTAAADGREAFRELAEQSRTLFTSRRQTLLAYRDEAGQVEIEVEFEGVLATSVAPQMPAGTTIRLRGRSRFTFRDGLIASIVDES